MLYLVGVGGAGSKIVDSFHRKNVVKKLISRIQTRDQERFAGIAADTSEKIKALSNIPPEHTVMIGKSRVKGHGTGVDVSLGQRIAKEELGLVMNLLRKTVSEKPWAVVIFAGLGGGTGTGAAPLIARKIKDTYRCKTLGVFILPSSGEGRVYQKNAYENLEKVASSVDGSLFFDNNVLTEKGEDILAAHQILNQHIQSFFRLVDEGFLERCFGNWSTAGYCRLDSDHVSVKEVVERILRDHIYLRFNMERIRKMVFIARGDLDALFGHDFAQGWAKNKFGVDLEYQFYGDTGARGVETGLLIVGTKDLNGRFDDIKEVKGAGQASELEALLKDITPIF